MITDHDLETVNEHWAIQAIREEERRRAEDVRKVRLVRVAVGDQISVEFDEVENDERLLERYALAYELVIMEGIDSIFFPTSDNIQHQRKSRASAFLAYEFVRVQKIPDEITDRIYHILRLIGLAYCGDRWTDIRRWVKEHPNETTVPEVREDEFWDRRLLYRLYQCWLRLVRKSGWDDLDQVRELIMHLREDQLVYESSYLEGQQTESRYKAFRLVALYHWAKATEVLATYMLQGGPDSIAEELNSHYEAAREAASKTGDFPLEMILRWLHVASRQMIQGSLWWVAQTVNARVTRFVTHATHHQGMFELLPPQRAAIQEQGLLDTANRAVVVNLPTSGGKTALAQFRMLLALNQFGDDGGWIAYVAPTRALVSQITRRLRKDFSPIGIEVVQLAGALEIDGFEEAILEDDRSDFHILVTTPEKLDMVIRNKKVRRPLVLVVMDEAHNIEDDDRGLRSELLLATIKRECDMASFLLLMPYVPNAHDLADWLSPQRGKTISLSTTPWQPNERIVGIFEKIPGEQRGDWSLTYETLITTQRTIHLRGTHKVGGNRPLRTNYSSTSATLQTGAMAKIFSDRGTSIAVARTINDAWTMATNIANSLPEDNTLPEEILLVQRFLSTEVSEDFLLIKLLKKRIGVHHAGLSDEVRSLMEWLAEEKILKVLCSTSTITQGINFPVSSIFLSSRYVPKGQRSEEMSVRDFWNLAGRAGRMDQDSVGVVGIASNGDKVSTIEYVRKAVDTLVSTLVKLLDQIDNAGKLNDLQKVIYGEQWAAFRSYIAHLWNEKQNLEAVIAETEQVLRNTLGYKTLRDKTQNPDAQRKAKALLDATKLYAEDLAQNVSSAVLADSTGFAPEGVRKAMAEMGKLENQLTTTDWEPESLFGSGSTVLKDLYGVMLNIGELAKPLDEIGGDGVGRDRIADMTEAWVNGKSLEEIAITYFAEDGEDTTKAISKACRAIYRTLTNYGTWGLASLSKLPQSGLDFETLSEESKRKINNLPAMIYYGVNSEPAILMRMNSVPRSVAEPLGNMFLERLGGTFTADYPKRAREFIKSLSSADWESVKPERSVMTGQDLQTIWRRLSGELDM